MKISNRELELTYKFKELAELKKRSGKDVDEFVELAKDFTNAPLLLSIGAGISEEEAIELIQSDESGFQIVVEIVKEFSEKATIYLTPNSQSQTN